MKQFTNNNGWIPKSLDMVVIMFGTWTILIQFFIYAGFNFDRLVAWSPALLISILFFLSWLVFLQPKRLVNTKGELRQGDRPKNQTLWLPLIGILVGVMLKQLFIFGVSAIVFLGALAAWNRQFLFAEIKGTASHQSRFEISVLLSVMIVTVIITTIVNRPDIDDAYYMNASMATLRHSDLPLLSFNGIYGDSNLPIQQSDQRPQTYMIFIALLSNWIGLSPRIIYYELFPALWAALVPLAYFVVLKRFCPKTAWVALPVSMLILLAWGEGHGVYGNFAFVRLFQAKAVLVTFLGPLFIHYAIDFMDKPALKTWCLLILLQCCAVGLSTTAAVTAPLAVFLSLLASAGLAKRRLFLALFGASTFLYNSVILIWVLNERVVYPEVGDLADILTVYHVIGSGIRGSIALLVFLLLPLLMVRQNHPYRFWMWRYVLLSVLLLFNGVTTNLAGQFISGVFSWRLYWAVPLPLFLGMSFGMVINEFSSKSTESAKRNLLWIICPAMVFIFFLTAGQWSISSSNGVYFDGPGPKVYPHSREVAEIVLKYATRDDLVLAPTVEASVLTGYENYPRQVFVRHHYLILQTGLPKEEADERITLGRIVDSGCTNHQDDKWAVGQLQSRDIKVVVFPKRFVDTCDYLMIWLGQNGYNKIETTVFQIWVKRPHSIAFEALTGPVKQMNDMPVSSTFFTFF